MTHQPVYATPPSASHLATHSGEKYPFRLASVTRIHMRHWPARLRYIARSCPRWHLSRLNVRSVIHLGGKKFIVSSTGRACARFGSLRNGQSIARPACTPANPFTRQWWIGWCVPFGYGPLTCPIPRSAPWNLSRGSRSTWWIDIRPYLPRIKDVVPSPSKNPAAQASSSLKFVIIGSIFELTDWLVTEA